MILSDKEILDLITSDPVERGYYLPLQFAKVIEAAVLAKLREQEPVYQWRRTGGDGRWRDAKKDEAYARVDDSYEARTLYKHLVPIPEWQPIETAPKTGCHLAFDARDHLHPYVIVWLGANHPDVDEAGWYEHWSFDPVEPTHWQPLPKPPMAAARSE